MILDKLKKQIEESETGLKCLTALINLLQDDLHGFIEVLVKEGLNKAEFEKIVLGRAKALQSQLDLVKAEFEAKFDASFKQDAYLSIVKQNLSNALNKQNK